MTTVLLEMNPPSFQTESLEMLGFKNLVRIHPHMKVQTAIVPTVVRREGRISPRAICWLRDEFRSRMHDGKPGRRIYISRDDADERRIVNERTLVSKLWELGFEEYTLSGMSFSDQVTLFSSADMIVAPHGSGLTNMTWAPPGTPVVEIFGDYVNPCYMTLAAALDHPYGFVQGTPQPDKDIAVDPYEVLEVIERTASEVNQRL